MSKKIVIDKEKIDFVTLKKLRRYFVDNDKTLFEQRMYSFIGKLIETFDIATEIDTDQSIEERAKHYAEHLGGGKYSKNDVYLYTQGATEQDLISKAREKDKFDELRNWIEYKYPSYNITDVLNKIDELKNRTIQPIH